MWSHVPISAQGQQPLARAYRSAWGGGLEECQHAVHLLFLHGNTPRPGHKRCNTHTRKKAGKAHKELPQEGQSKGQSPGKGTATGGTRYQLHDPQTRAEEAGHGGCTRFLTFLPPWGRSRMLRTSWSPALVSLPKRSRVLALPCHKGQRPEDNKFSATEWPLQRSS